MCVAALAAVTGGGGRIRTADGHGLALEDEVFTMIEALGEAAATRLTLAEELTDEALEPLEGVEEVLDRRWHIS